MMPTADLHCADPFVVHTSVLGRSSIPVFWSNLYSHPHRLTRLLQYRSISSLIEALEKLLLLLTFNSFWCCLQAIDKSCYQEAVAIDQAFGKSFQRPQISCRHARSSHASILLRLKIVSTSGDSGALALSVTETDSGSPRPATTPANCSGKKLG